MGTAQPNPDGSNNMGELNISGTWAVSLKGNGNSDSSSNNTSGSNVDSNRTKSETESDTKEKFLKACLDRHNEYRAKYGGVPPLKLNSEVMMTMLKVFNPKNQFHTLWTTSPWFSVVYQGRTLGQVLVLRVQPGAEGQELDGRTERRRAVETKFSTRGFKKANFAVLRVFRIKLS